MLAKNMGLHLVGLVLIIEQNAPTVPIQCCRNCAFFPTKNLLPEDMHMTISKYLSRCLFDMSFNFNQIRSECRFSTSPIFPARNTGILPDSGKVVISPLRIRHLQLFDRHL